MITGEPKKVQVGVKVCLLASQGKQPIAKQQQQKQLSSSLAFHEPSSGFLTAGASGSGWAM